MSKVQGNQALAKAFSVIDSIADGNRNLKDICEQLGLPKSTVHRILQGLIEARYIREVKGIGLVLGTKMIQLGIRAQADMPLKEIAKPYIRELAKLTQDTVHLGIKDEEFMAATDATYKMSIRFDEFYKKGAGHFHYHFGSPDFNGTHFNVNDWWFSSKIQEARIFFCDKFANHPKKPLQKLKKSLTL